MGIWSKVSAYSSLGIYLLSLWYRPSSINVRSIVLLAVPRCHVIAPGGVASLRPQISIALSRHSACRLAATWIPPYRVYNKYNIYITYSYIIALIITLIIILGFIKKKYFFNLILSIYIL